MIWLMGIYRMVMASKAMRIAFMVGAGVLAVLTFGAVQKRKGATQERGKQERIDNENATVIRKRVRNVKRVSDDALKYRND